MGTPVQRLSSHFCLLGGGRPHRWHRFSKLKKASLKQFCFLTPDGLKLVGSRPISLIFLFLGPDGVKFSDSVEDGWMGKDEFI